MKTSIKLGVTAAAGLLGIALATSSAFAATGPLTARHASGRALQGTGTTMMSTATSTTTTPTTMPTATGTTGTTMMPTPTSTTSTTMMR